MNIMIMTNYNIHKLSYKNNLNKIKKILKKDKKLLYKKGMNGEYPIHISCLIGSKKLIDLFLDYDKNILKLKNSKGQTGYHILVLYPNILIEKLKDISKKFDINIPDDQGYTILISYLLNTKKVNIKVIKKLKDLGADINKPKNNSKIDEILVKNCDLLDELVQIFNVDINAYNSNKLTPMHTMIANNNIKCIQKLIKYNVNVRNSGIFNYALRHGNNEIINILLKQDIDYEYTNKCGDTYLHTILLSTKNNYKKEVIRYLLEKRSNVNIQNIDGSTIIHLLIKTGLWKKYDTILKKKNIDISLINKEGKKPLDYLSKKDKEIFKIKILKNKKTIRELSRSRSKSDKKIKLLNFREEKYTIFTASLRDCFIYNIILLRKYSNIGLPFCNNKKKKTLSNKLLKNDNKMKMKLWYTLKLSYENFNGLLCSRVYWYTSDLYFIHDNFFKALEKKMHKEFVFFNINLISVNYCHANIVIIDNILETIERFDPYGISGYNEMDKLDQLLDKELNKIIFKKKNKKYKYLSPIDYLRIYSFQALSNEKNILNQNYGDPGGFCLAWCYWYLESRLNNPGIKQSILVDKLRKKLINNTLSITSYIRSYANKLSLEKAKLLKEFKILPSEYYKVAPANKEIIKLYGLVFNNLQQLSKKL